MSKRKILSALKKKGLSAGEIEYQRACPTPGGYCDGWTINLSEESELLCCDAACDWDWDPNFNGGAVDEVMEWIESLPDCSSAIAKATGESE